MKRTKTHEQEFEEALNCNTKEEAELWLESEIDYLLTCDGFLGDRNSAREVIRNNIGYMAGYYDQATSQKIYDLFGAEHPIFGKPDHWTRITPEMALEMGRKRGEEWKKKHWR